MTKKIITIGLVAAMMLSVVGPSAASAEEVDDLQAQIAALQEQLNALLGQLTDLEGDDDAPAPSGGACPSVCSGVSSFDRTLSVGMTGDDVKCLQGMLNSDGDTLVASSGVGSAGSETSYYGNLTKGGVVKFQEKYADEVLASWGLTSGTGYFGSTSRAKMNALLASCGEEPEPDLTCADYSAEDDCTADACYWYASACHTESEAEATCPDYTVETECTDGGCYWYSDVCNAEEEVEPVSAGLTVAVASDTPAATTLADGTAFNNMLKLKFTAGSEGDVSVTGLKVVKGGISADTYVEGILIVDQNGNRHGAIITSLAADSTASLTFSDDPIVVPAGGSAYVTVQVNLGSAFGSGTIYMSVAGASDVTSNAGSVSGTFPAMGNTMSVVDGSTTVGGLYVDAVSFHANGSDDTTVVNVNLGTIDQILGKIEFTESAGSANEAVKIEKVTIYNNGNTTDADIANIDLVAPDGTVLATLPSLTNKYGTFDLSSSPYVIPDGTAKIFTLRCDIVSGSTRTVRLLIENDFDVVVKGVSSGASLLATVDSAGTDQSFPVGDQATGGNYMNKVTINSGSLSVSKKTSSPSGNLAVGSSNQKFAEFKITASGEDMRVEKVQVCVNIPTGGTELAGTFKLQDEGDVTLWSLAASTDNLYDTGTCAQYTLTTRKTVLAGTSITFKFVGDVASTAATTDSYQVQVSNLYTKRMSSGDYVTYSTSYVNGNTLTVDTSALSLAKNDAYGNTTEVAGGSKMKIASYVVQAGAAEAINISSFKVTLGTFNGGAVGDYTNMVVEDGDGNQLGSTVVSPVAAGDTLSVSGFTIDASGSKIMNIFADITSAAATGETVVATLGTFGATGATSTTTITSPTATTGQTITWASSGALTVSTDTSNPGVAVLHAQESEVTVLKFILSSLYEDINVTKIVLDSTYGPANLSTVYLYEGETLVSSASLLSGKATFNGLSLQVAKDGAKYLTVKVDTTASGTLISAQDMKLMVNDVDSTGGASGVVIYPSNVSTAASAGMLIEAGTTAATVTSTDGFSVGDAVLAYNVTDGVEWGMVISVDSAVAMKIGTENDHTAAASRITRLSSPVTTAASTATPLVGGVSTTVTSSAGFAVGDAVLVFNATDGVELGMITAITSETAMTVAVKTNMTAAASRITKLASGSTTAASAGIPLDTGAAVTVTSTTGFSVGDIVFVYNATDGVELGMVTVVTNATTMTISTEADMTTAAAYVTKLGTFGTTAASAGIPLVAGVSTTVTSSDGFTLGDPVVIYNATDGPEIGMVTAAVSTSTAMTLAPKANCTVAAARVSELWSLTGVGNPYVVHDVEPVIELASTSPSGTGSGSTLETVAMFDITATGTRDLKIESLNLYRGGSTTTEVAVGSAPKIYVGSSLIGTGANWGSAAPGAVSNVDFSTPYTVSAGQTVTFIIKVNTSSITTVNATFQVYISGTAGVKTAANAAMDWFYTAASPSPGVEPTEASPASYSDSYSIYGNTLRY